MKKLFTVISLLLAANFIYGQAWVGVTSTQPKPAKLILVSGSVQSSTIHLQIPGYSRNTVLTPNGVADVIDLEDATRLLVAGAPDLIKVTASVIIPDNANMNVQVTYSNYVDFPNAEIAPSKGNLTRDIDPAMVPYTYGSAYTQNQFYPGTLAELRSPYILRDFRGQTVIFYPFQYNPVNKVLRVYTDIIVNVSQTGISSTNVYSRTKPITSIDKEFSEIYKNHFLNYTNNYKYTPLNENGKMLIICNDAWLSAMQPLVNWKITEGIPCDLVGVSTIGNTTTAIKNYVTNYYNTNGLTFLLLVGDALQVTTFTSNGGGSDPSYGYLVGNDSYQEIFVGRFSAESLADVQTQVTRTINYEVTPSTTPGKYNRCIGIGSDQGPGDDNEMDFEHQRNLQLQLMGFTYTSKAELFDGSQGGLDATGNPTAAMLGTEINNGAGLITYCGHGSDNSFGTTGFSNTDIANLTNTNILPFVWSVACVNGNFTAGTCFAEGWMRKTYNNQPAGAVATLMSTINQSWNPPMEGQDEMVNILTENAGTNIKRTFGGLSVNGIFKMNDTYADYAMTDTWTIFGDPSLMVRTNNPATMTVTHNPTLPMGSSSLTVNCNVPGAKVCLTINYQIIATAYVTGGVANLSFTPLTQIDTITVCVTAFNYIPYLGSVLIVSNNYPNDISMESILEPVSSYNCSGINVQPRVVFRNFGTNTLTSATFSYTLDGGSPVTQSWTGSLVQFASDTILFPPFTLTLGNHTFQASSSNPNGTTDNNPANDSQTKNFTVSNLSLSSAFTADQTEFCTAPADVQFTNQSQNAITYLWDFGDGSSSTDANPSHTYSSLGTFDVTLTAGAGACGNDVEALTAYITVGADAPVVTDALNCGPAALTLFASGSGTINWYDAPSGGNLVTSGNSYTTPFLTNTTTYYTQQVVTPPLQYVGKFDSVGGGANHTNNSYYLIFDCTTPVILKSVKVYSSTAGNRIIELRNSSGTVLQTATVNIPVGESRVTLNFNVPVQTNMQLACGTSAPNLYRSTGGISFPYNLSGKISITGTSAAPSLRWYYFYDWEIESPSCVSALVPVTAFINNNVPGANFSYTSTGLTVNFTDASVNPSTYNWNFGDGGTSSSQSPVHTYASPGGYSVTLIITNGCGADTTTQDITVSSSGMAEISSSVMISVYPNPAQQGIVNINFASENPLKYFSVYNALGQETIGVFNTIGQKQINIRWDTGKVEPGIYYLHFTTEDGIIVRKLVLTE